MKYLNFTFEDVTYWIELNDDNYALRQIVIKSNGNILISCINDCLAEGIVSIDKDTNIITPYSFEKIWSKYLSSYYVNWEKVKSKYPIGKKVEGIIKYFYPQGIIIQLTDTQGITDYEKCRENSISNNFYPNQKIIGTVTGYDETNMWIILSNSVIY